MASSCARTAALQDFTDGAQVKALYYAACEALLMQATGPTKL